KVHGPTDDRNDHDDRQQDDESPDHRGFEKPIDASHGRLDGSPIVLSRASLSEFRLRPVVEEPTEAGTPTKAKTRPGTSPPFCGECPRSLCRYWPTSVGGSRAR